MNKAELLAKLAQKRSRLQELNAKFDSLSADEQNELRALVTELEKLQLRLSGLEAEEAAIRSAAGGVAPGATPAPPAPAPAPAAPAPGTTGLPAGDTRAGLLPGGTNPHVTIVTRGDEHLPFRGFSIWQGDRLIKNPNQDERDLAMGEFMHAIRRSENSGVLDPRLELVRKHADEQALKRHSKVDNEAGYIIQADIMTDLTMRAFENGKLVSRCSSAALGPNSNRLVRNVLKQDSRATGSRWGGMRAYWVNEKNEATASRLSMKKFEVGLQKLMAIYNATDEELQDAGQLGAGMRQGVINEFGFLLDDAVLRGSGTDEPFGILNSAYGGCVTVTATSAAGSLEYADLLDMIARADGNGLAWFYNRELIPVLAQVVMPVGLGGAPIFVPGGKIPGINENQLLGYPMIEIEQCNAPNTKGDLILADMSAYQIIRKGAIQEDSSIHVYFTTAQNAFRFQLRVGGAPIPETPWTPYKGSKSRSPFVLLGDRS